MRRLFWLIALLGVFASECAAQSTGPATRPAGVSIKICDYQPEAGSVIEVERQGSKVVFRQNISGNVQEIPAKSPAYTMYILPDHTVCALEVTRLDVVNFAQSSTQSIWNDGLFRYPFTINDHKDRLAVEATQFNPSRHSILVFDTRRWTRASLDISETPAGLAFSGDKLFMAIHSKLLSVDTAAMKDGGSLEPATVGDMKGQLLAMSGQTPVYVDGEYLCFGQQKTKIGMFADYGAYTIGDSVLVWARTEKFDRKIFRARPDREAELVAEPPAKSATVSGIGGHLNFFWVVIDDQHVMTVGPQWKPAIVDLPKLR
jgi:hypothetical protein